MQTKTIFHFSSRQHPGCQIYVTCKEIDDLEVFGERDSMIIHEVGTCNWHEEVGSSRVHGKLYGFKNRGDKNPLSDDIVPFNIEIVAYSPPEDKDYKLIILGLWLTDDSGTGKVDFVAAALRPWFIPGAEQSQQTMPYNWHEIPLTLKSKILGGECLVGEIENWKKKEDQQYEHIHKLPK